MRIGVRLGSGLAQVAGGPRLEVHVAEGATVGDVLRRVGEDRPELERGLQSALTVVRGSQVGGDRVLVEGEEVALLMPVAGGQGPARGSLERRGRDGDS